METDEQESNSPRKETFDKKVKAKLAGGPADKHMWTSVSLAFILSQSSILSLPQIIMILFSISHHSLYVFFNQF